MFSTPTRVAAGLVVLCMSPAVRGNGFVDDFEDGSVTDGDPVSWSQAGCCPGGTRVEGGDFVMLDDVRDNTVTGYVANRVCEGDVSVRTQVRFNGRVGLTAHIVGTAFYYGVFRETGELLLRRSDEPNFTFSTLGSVFVSTPNPQVDYIVKLETRGNLVEFSAWPSDGPKPTPQISVVDTTYRSGTTGLTFFNESDGTAEARFRHFSVTDPIEVPASSGWGLLAMIVGMVAVGGVVLTRRRSPSPMTARA